MLSMQFYPLVVARVEAETHDVRRDFVREARARKHFFEHGHEVPGVRLFIRSPGAGRRDFCDVFARPWNIGVTQIISEMTGGWEKRSSKILPATDLRGSPYFVTRVKGRNGS